MPARFWSRIASWVASSKVSLASVCPYSSALILSRAVQNQPGKPWLPITWVYSRGSLEVMFRPFLNEMLLNLADGRAREDVAKLHDRGHLVGGQPLAAPVDQFVGGRDGAILHHDIGLDGLVPNRVRNRHHGRVEDGGVLLQGLFHLRGGHVLAGALDHILLPVHEEAAAVLVPVGLVAAVEPSVAQRLGRRLVVLEVALHQRHARHAAHHELTDRARGYFLA